MTITNKVTKLFAPAGGTMTEELIQSHMDEQNSAGYYLIGVDNMVGWYRFFWAKEVA